MKQQGTPSDILQLVTNSESWRSVAMSWALFALSQNKHAQNKLREEISNISTDNPTDDLNGLPYLDAVVRETLRLHPPVAAIPREAGKDDCIPLSKPFTDKKGIVRNEIR
jgi:Cytochrome P450